MTIMKHELRQGRTAFLIWTGAIAFMLAICILIFPEMKAEMASVSKIFSAMGAFTAAFGMDRLDFGSLTGYYSIECGNVLGICGALYAAVYAVDILSKEERGKTAEFLLTHPVSRARVLTEKLLAVFCLITVMNAVIYVVALVSMILIGEAIPWKEINLTHLAYYLMQLELAGICFGISAFIKRGSTGAGMGLAAILYFMNLFANISKSVRFVKYITPFGYCEGADITTAGKLNMAMVAIGMAIGALGIAAGYWKYLRKDIQ